MILQRICLVIIPFCAVSAYGSAINVDLRTADSFAVLAASTVTNTGVSNIHGNLGVWDGSAVTDFPPGIVAGGSIHAADPVAMQAQSDLTAAYNFAAGQACDSNLGDPELGGLTLTPGVYCFATIAQLTGAVTLNALGNPNSVFIFKIGSTLTTGSGSSVLFQNGGQGGSVFWQVGSSATLGTTTSFQGNILAQASITLNTDANIGCGRALARTGAVTLDSNDVSIGTSGCLTTNAGPDGGVVPEPGTASMLTLGGLAGMMACGWKFRRREDSKVPTAPTDQP
jgi:hypothetical protein